MAWRQISRLNNGGCVYQRKSGVKIMAKISINSKRRKLSINETLTSANENEENGGYQLINEVTIMA
jgi:hypothetical protein